MSKQLASLVSQVSRNKGLRMSTYIQVAVFEKLQAESNQSFFIKKSQPVSSPHSSMKKTIVLLLVASVSFSSEGILVAQTSTGYRPMSPEMQELAAYYAQRRKEGGSNSNSSSSISGWNYWDASYPYAFISVAPSVMFVSSNKLHFQGESLSSENITMFGGMVGAGLYFNENLRFSLDVGYYEWDKTRPIGSIFGYAVSLKEKYDIVPIWFTADYVLNLPHDFQFRIGPTIGVTMAELKLTASTSAGSASVSNTDWMFTYGVNTGLTWQFDEHLSVGLDYRFCASTGPTFEKGGYTVEYGTVLSHQIVLSLGWRF
ncbi:MAG: porin family protein [Puniceicoccales bacterium]|jgi:opacity protein-like surface antigen|nr:porin family protein [Puniceicoccales bacterium]